MKTSQENYDVAQALSAAFEPLIDLCLQIGFTSPEIESLLRATFVQRAFLKLPRHVRTARGPSDSRVSLATGVHRSEVSKIRGAGTASAKGTMQKKQRLYSKSTRILLGWAADPRFLTSGGQPLDLPVERNRERRSFEDLVEKYAPGNHPGSVLKELRRRRMVEVLNDDIVRYRSPTPRSVGITKSNVAVAARRLKHLGDTLFQNISNPAQVRYFAETKAINLTAQQLLVIQAVLERRAKTFLDSVENEIQSRSAASLHGDTKRMGVAVYSWEDE
jgi:hypothetical protein